MSRKMCSQLQQTNYLSIIARLLPLTLLILLVAAPVIAQDDSAAKRREFYENLRILGDVYERIVNNYVDEVDAHEILQAGINGMLEELDEHSAYLPPETYEDLMMSTEGEFGGLGITINVRDHYPTVVSPIEGTPAYYMGIQGGDQIIEIEGESSHDFSSRDAVKLLRGEPGTNVNIQIKRPGKEDPIPFTITRDIIKVESVPYGFMIDDIGYVRIQNFARTTKSELITKLDMLTDQGMRGLILDLRFNPGGLLEAAHNVSEIFLDREDLIVFTKGRVRSANRSFQSASKGKSYGDLPTIVMINGSSASASEIVSAAIQDHDAGLVVGKTSFGKGSVQTVFRLDDNEALKLTTARYYTPSGRSIHQKRDRNGRIETAESEDAEDTAAEDTAPDPTADLRVDPAEAEIPRFDRDKFFTDSGRVVYGGGGITPDIELNQDFLSDFEFAVERDGALFSFAVDYAASGKETPVDFTVSDELLGEFKEYLGEREKIEEYLGVFELALSDSLFDANSGFVERGIRREIARRAHGAEAAYRVAIEADEQLHGALELFRKAKTLPELLALAQEWNEEQMQQIAADSTPQEQETVNN